MGYLREHMIEEMTLQGYSQRTINIYVFYVHKLALFFNKKPTDITKQELRRFFFYLYDSGNSLSIIHCYYHALLFFFSLHNMREYITSIPRPKKVFKVPTILTKEEVKLFLDNCSDFRYKTLFTLLYSSGLRISEGLNLKITDIDFNRKLIFVSESKNRKERYAIIGDNTIKLLKEYIKNYAPINYLFFNFKNKAIPMRSRRIQDVFQQYFSKTHINKSAHVHTLRHSFATHLLEHNVNIFYIMRLLGHSSINSTMIYLHAQRFDLLDIKSPIDTIEVDIPKITVIKQLELPLAS